jgi:hypothetical protein
MRKSAHAKDAKGAEFSQVRSAECGIRESQIPPHPNPLTGGEGAPSAVLGIILISAQFHGWVHSRLGLRLKANIEPHLSIVTLIYLDERFERDAHLPRIKYEWGRGGTRPYRGGEKNELSVAFRGCP